MRTVTGRFNNEQQQRQSRDGKSCGLDVKPEVPFREGQQQKEVNMRKIPIAIMAACLAGTMGASASLYNTAYTETANSVSSGWGGRVGVSGVTATGWLDVSGGIATAGQLTVVGGTYAGTYNLMLGTGSNNSFAWDNFVMVGQADFLTATAGLAWQNGSTMVNMFYNGSSGQLGAPGGTFSLWGAPPNFSMQTYGDATLTAVPEPTTMLAGAGALGLALLGIGRARRPSVVRIGS
jgi:hypothetical protein